MNKKFNSIWQYQTVLANINLRVIFVLTLLAAQASVFSQEIVAPLDQAIIKAKLGEAPSEFSKDAAEQAVEVTLPMMDGVRRVFKCVESPVMEEALKANWVRVTSYQGYSRSENGELLVVRINVFDDQLYAYIFDQHQVTVIQPDGTSRSNYKVSLQQSAQFSCLTREIEHDHQINPDRASCNSMGGTRRDYKFAFAATGEYTNWRPGKVTQVQMDMTNLIANINVIYEAEMAIHFNLIASNNLIIFTNGASDPFTPASNRDACADCAQTGFSSLQLTNLVPESTYDVGHVLHYESTGGGFSGQAGPFPCVKGSKARGWSQVRGAQGFDVSYLGGILGHEVGHQYGANHPFFGNSGSCNGNRYGSTAYEPGAGTTYMSYNGSCAPQDINNNERDLYFHTVNLNEIGAGILAAQGSCSSNTSSGNSPPVVNANPSGAMISIPSRTPFELTGSATDANGDPLTYCWEQYDTDTTSPGGAPNSGATMPLWPLFRSFPPTVTATRSFPQLADILSNSQTQGEILSQVARSMKFRLTVRDRYTFGGLTLGGWACDDLAVNVVNVGSTGFAVTSQNVATTWSAGSTQTIIWSVVNTNMSPISCATVNILLSIDGGLTFPLILASNTPNDGNQTITLSVDIPATTQARIKVVSAGNANIRFFDINDVNIKINSFCQATANSICSDAPLLAIAGSSTLNLGLSPIFGNPVSSLSLTTSATTLQKVGINLTPQASGPGTTCTSVGGVKNYGITTYRFNISYPGNYKFSLSANSVLSVYKDSFSTAAPCLNYIGSTGFDNNGIPGDSFSFTSTMILDLTNACQEYELVLYTINNTTRNITISGPAGSTIYSSNSLPPPGYSYTYLAVNTSTNLVTAVSSSSQFTSLPTGNYCIYGMLYYSGSSSPPVLVNPISFVGQTLSTLQGFDRCMVLSSNCKPITVTSSCNPPIAQLNKSGELTCAQPMITLTATPATGMTYNWGVGATPVPGTNKATVTSAGTYTVTVTNISDGCSGTSSVTVLNNGGLVAVLFQSNNITCLQAVATLTATPALGMTYAWSSGATPVPGTNTATVVLAGTYTVTVTAVNNGCKSTASMKILNNTTAPSAKLTKSNDISCANPLAKLLVEPVPGMNYAWSTGASSNAINVTAAATYKVTVTNSVNGCVTIDSIKVDQNTTAPAASFTKSNDLTCSLPSATLFITPVAGMNYVWSTGALTNSIVVGAAGTFTVTVTDTINGCTTIAAIEVKANKIAPVAAVTKSNDLTCTNPSATLTATMILGMSYAWNTGATTNSIVVGAAGTFTVTVTDSTNGCTTTAAIEVKANKVAPNAAVTKSNDLTCTKSFATLTATLLAGKNYAWNTGASTSSINITTAKFYVVTVTDPINGCTTGATIEVKLDTASPKASISTPTVITCRDPIVELTATQLLGMNYEWSTKETTNVIKVSTAATYKVTVTDPKNGCTKLDSVKTVINTTPPSAPFTKSNDITCAKPSAKLEVNPAPGMTIAWSTLASTNSIVVGTGSKYTVTVTDPNNGCATVVSFVVDVDIEAPKAQITKSNDISCGKDTATLAATPATLEMKYFWTAGASPVLGSNLAKSTAGTYTVTVLNTKNGCSGTSSIVVEDLRVLVGDFKILSSESCLDSSITLNARNLRNMGTQFGIIYKVDTIPLTAPYSSGTVIGSVTNSELIGDTSATSKVSFSTPGKYYIYAIVNPALDTCYPFKVDSVIIVNPTGYASDSALQTVCHGSATEAISFAGSPLGVYYDWSIDQDSIGIAVSGTGNIPSFEAKNKGTLPITAVITVIPKLKISGATCFGKPFFDTLTVYPKPYPGLVKTDDCLPFYQIVNRDFNGNLLNKTFSVVSIHLDGVLSTLSETSILRDSNLILTPAVKNIAVKIKEGICFGETDSTYTTVDKVSLANVSIVVCEGDSSLIAPNGLGNCYKFGRYNKETNEMKYPIDTTDFSLVFIDKVDLSKFIYFVRVHDCDKPACGKTVLVRSDTVENCNSVTKMEISLFPNPNTGTFTLQLTKGAYGVYDVFVVDMLGRNLHRQKVDKQLDDQLENITIANTIASQLLHVVITGPTGETSTVKLIIMSQ